MLYWVPFLAWYLVPGITKQNISRYQGRPRNNGKYLLPDIMSGWKLFEPDVSNEIKILYYFGCILTALALKLDTFSGKLDMVICIQMSGWTAFLVQTLCPKTKFFGLTLSDDRRLFRGLQGSSGIRYHVVSSIGGGAGTKYRTW